MLAVRDPVGIAKEAVKELGRKAALLAVGQKGAYCGSLENRITGRHYRPGLAFKPVLSWWNFPGM